MELRTILILAEGQLGDLLLLTPAVRSLRAGHPRAEITVVIYQRRLPQRAMGSPILFHSEGGGTASVMTRHPAVSRVFEVDRSLLRSMSLPRRLRAELSILRTLRSYRFDAVLCTFPEDRFSVTAYLSGARVRAGERGKGLSHLLTVAPAVTRSTAGVLRYYCTLAEAMGGHAGSPETSYAATPDAERTVDAWLSSAGLQAQRYVAIHPGATGEYKQWPPERFAGLIGRMQRAGIPVALCGGTADEAILDAITSQLESRVPLLPGVTEVSVLAAFLQRAGVCVTNDSGPRHLAVAVGAPSIAIFRQHHGTEWAVYEETERCVTLTGKEKCPSCPPDTCLDRIPEGQRHGSFCLRQIGEEEVLGAVRAMLGATSP